jgi:predicted transcriptional regulator
MSFDMESLDQVALRIRSMRKSAGLSQARLAKMCGLSQSTVARIEKDINRLNPSYSTIYSIVDDLNVVSKKYGNGEILRKKAYEIMHRRIVFVRPTNYIADAISLFMDYGFQQLPVLDTGRRVVGTVYEKDLLSIATQSPELVRRRNVGSVMKTPLPQIDKNTEIIKVKPMLENWDAVLVVENGKAVGIVTIYDILKNV